MSNSFEDFQAADVADLIAEYPLAWICARHGRADEASLLPLVGEYDEAGTLIALIGHLARRNPLHAALADDPGALILFCGPQAYVSPQHSGRRNWAPTWNYAQLRIEADIVFEDDETMGAIAMLVDAMERGRPDPWVEEELGDRRAPMQRAIIGFRASVTALRGKFKLGQDETLETLRAILAAHGDPALVRWMERFNTGRL